MIGALNAELRQDKWGVIFDGLYVKMSADGDPTGRLLSNVSVGIKQAVLEGAVAYRVFESEKAWIDLLAGARYMYMGTSLRMTLDNSGVTSVTQDLSSRVIDRATQTARDEVNKRLPELIGNLGPELSDRVQNRVAGRVDEIRETLKDRIEAEIGGAGRIWHWPRNYRLRAGSGRRSMNTPRPRRRPGLSKPASMQVCPGRLSWPTLRGAGRRRQGQPRQGP